MYLCLFTTEEEEEEARESPRCICFFSLNVAEASNQQSQLRVEFYNFYTTTKLSISVSRKLEVILGFDVIKQKQNCSQ